MDRHIGDAVTASEPRRVNEIYGCHILLSQVTAAALGADLDLQVVIV
jgi:hypothetical protein